MLARAGLPAADAVKYELDHFVPLAVGGHPHSEDNPWLQKWDGAWNARVKERPERRLQVMVCAGEITLHTARTAIQHDWLAAYCKYVAADPFEAELAPDRAAKLRVWCWGARASISGGTDGAGSFHALVVR
jgi:hypothetical protein